MAAKIKYVLAVIFVRKKVIAKNMSMPITYDLEIMQARSVESVPCEAVCLCRESCIKLFLMVDALYLLQFFKHSVLGMLQTSA